MDVGLHQRAERSIDHPVALDGFFAGEVARANADVEVAAAIASTGMTGVTATVVDDLELVGLERGLEAPADEDDPFSCHG